MKEVCQDCNRKLADTKDEAIHNTGECGCDQARSFCWRKWNNNKCESLSPYDPAPNDPDYYKNMLDNIRKHIAQKK